MTNENETVEQITEEISNCCNCWVGNNRTDLAVSVLRDWHKRILAAHKREMAEQSAVNEAQAAQLRDALNECENLKWKVENYAQVVAANDAEIDTLRSLVKELSDALKKIDDACDGDMCKHFINTEQCSKCKYLKTCQTGIAHNALKTNESEISKAREMRNA